MHKKFLFYDNDNVIKLDGVKNSATGDWVNSSTNVTARVVTRAATPAEVVAAITLDYVAASDGNYRKIMDKALLDSVTAGNYYIEYVVAEGGLDLKILQNAEVAERILR